MKDRYGLLRREVAKAFIICHIFGDQKVTFRMARWYLRRMPKYGGYRP